MRKKHFLLVQTSLMRDVIFASRYRFRTQLKLFTLHLVMQQLELHVGWHLPPSQRRTQGQGLNCISRVMISLEMDHDENECLGLCAAMD